MNQYHIYEAIGRGKHSTVYKGRKKKSVEHYAIKSVEKAQKSGVLQEVRTLHSLDHNNILKFYAWYETPTHLWLVLEYCVGGDLLTLLRQDVRLPEESIHDFARDLVEALQYLHSKGVIYGDLKPSNVLLDENGRLKLCDFGLARYLCDVSKSSVQQLPQAQAKRGTPCYMAPELFQGGVHSFVSDLWALGCVMYECFAGSPPFVSTSFNQLVNSIITDSPPLLCGNPTREFENLVSWLLVKDPAKRLQWPELREHPFWRNKFRVYSIPSQPAEDKFLWLTGKSGTSSQKSVGDTDAQEVTSISLEKWTFQERSMKWLKSGVNKKTLKSSGNDDSDVKSVVPMEKNSMSSNANILSRGGETVTGSVSSTETCGLTNGVVNVLRMSRIVKTNLRRDDQDQYQHPDYGGPPSNSVDVTVENHDQELEFDEGFGIGMVEGKNAGAAPNHHEVSFEGIHLESRSVHQISGTLENKNNLFSSQSTLSNGKDCDDCFRSTKLGSARIETLCLDGKGPPTGVDILRELRHQAACTGEPKKDKSGFVFRTTTMPAKAYWSVSQALWHPSDLSVQPIVVSERVDNVPVDTEALPVDALHSSDIVKLSSRLLDSFTIKIMANLQGHSALHVKINTLRYVESLCNNIDTSNLLINGPLMPLLVKMLKMSKPPRLREELAFVMGLLVRHATLIEDELANTGIIPVLTDAARDKQEKVRQCAMATLGELLFYIANQNEGLRESQGRVISGGQLSVWQVPGSTFTLIASILRKSEDDVTHHYALKTIENISSQGGNWASRFTTPEILDNLCHNFKSSAKPENIRATAGSCLVRLVRFSPVVIPSVLDRLTFKDLVTGLTRCSAREQQVSLNLLNMALVGSSVISNMAKHMQLLLYERTVVQNLMALLEGGLEVLRGKAFLCAGLLCKINQQWLPSLCNAKLMLVVERSAQERDSHIQQCIEALVQMIVSVIPEILESISTDIAQVAIVKQTGTVAPAKIQPRSSILLFPVMLHLFNNPIFKGRLTGDQVLKQIVGFLNQMEKLSFQGQEEFQSTLLQIIEVISQKSTVLGYPDIFIIQILPSLALLYKTNTDGDMRFLCFKVFFDILVLYSENISETESQQPNPQFCGTETRISCVTHMELLVGQHFLPLYTKLVEDEDPIPIYARKLMMMMLDHRYIKIADIIQLNLIPHFFEFLMGDLSNVNVQDVQLCVFLVSAPEVDTNTLSKLKILRKIGALLHFVYTKSLEEFLEPVLSVCRFFLVRNSGDDVTFSGGKKGSVGYSCVEDITELGKYAGIFLELCGSQVLGIAEASAECLVLIVKCAPQAAARGVFASLSKLAHVFELCASCHGPEVLQHFQCRLLFALAEVCKEQRTLQILQPLSPPVLSNSELIALENTIIRLRKSNVPQVVEAAISAVSELQRLPHQ